MGSTVIHGYIPILIKTMRVFSKMDRFGHCGKRTGKPVSFRSLVRRLHLLHVVAVYSASEQMPRHLVVFVAFFSFLILVSRSKSLVSSPMTPDRSQRTTREKTKGL
ncbi:uncharacterized protein ASPGLDRAFT_472962 [Aspergillus glaucus CBS 516.65]|uniref:Uncharacterized protein n=1 Tax=Aspergillus glaucus CBS 516.65 TaxID=1160497 RepID=A0A1L9VH61_ASPGL|nr:hypothetical protein ASPGLDRAFT_472962 [Aspergillus glaucus CBS 516.65]OJJ83230.1 hypothetical protein ASPGLDRAFT_472962 [Aspergillus glaucus CBS 516.65]